MDLTWETHFSAAHRVHSAHLTAQQNVDLYSKCNNPCFHGHNYRLIVIVRGPVDLATGMVLDLRILKERVAAVVDQLDHRNINLEIEAFKDCTLPATSENLLLWIWQRLEAALGPHAPLLHEIQLWETPRICVKFRRPHSRL
eukprot:EG_transcript_37320